MTIEQYFLSNEDDLEKGLLTEQVFHVLKIDMF
jgi:hypothetical protein